MNAINSIWMDYKCSKVNWFVLYNSNIQKKKIHENDFFHTGKTIFQCRKDIFLAYKSDWNEQGDIFDIQNRIPHQTKEQPNN